jgi:hydroxyacylglutathione hydrolase
MRTGGEAARGGEAGGAARPRTVIETFTLGPFETNCYLVYQGPPTAAEGSGAGRACWVVDASFEPADLIERVRALDLRPEKLILTHAHVDHIAGVEEVLRAFAAAPIELSIHGAEVDWLSDPMKNLSAMMGEAVTTRAPSRVLKEGDELRLGDSVWRVLHTPGHSPGGITLHNQAESVALVGDSLFAGSIGRTDFPGSSFEQLAASIRAKLYQMPAATRVLPGHGPATTVGRERETNPFVRG